MARVHFLNVDEGDCTIIEHDNGDVTMIDVCCGNLEVGEIEKSFDQISANGSIKGNFNQKAHPINPIEYLQELGIKSIFRYIQTHPDMDHMDGLDQLAQNFIIWNFWDTENIKPSPFDVKGKFGRYKKKDWERYCKFRKSIKKPKALFYYDGSATKYFAEDENGVKQDDYIRILAPTKELIKAANETKDWNDSSYVILYCIQGFKILFCGDADSETLFHLTTNHAADIKDIDVLVAPHHGRDSDKDFSFLDIMNPQFTLMGNAKSKYMAYDEWNKRNFKHFTNNQIGNLLIEIDGGILYMSITNKTFADNFCQENFKRNSNQHDEFSEYWKLFRFSRKKK